MEWFVDDKGITTTRELDDTLKKQFGQGGQFQQLDDGRVTTGVT